VAATEQSQGQRTVDVVVVGGGHNGLVAAIYLARAGLSVVVLEQKHVLGGAVRTEAPFTEVPGLRASTGAYLLGLAPPELLADLGVDLPLRRRDPHYFLPTTDGRYLLFGSDEASLREQFVSFFSESDWKAHVALNAEMAALRDDVAASWLAPPLSLEDTAERWVRPALRGAFIDLCRGSIADYLARFDFRSDLVKAMYAVTDAFAGVDGGYDSPGTGLNFLAHNMCRLPGSGGTWMIVDGGMGTVARMLADKAREHGAILRENAKVASIETTNGCATGVVLEGGERIDARAIVANADPWTTKRLVGEAALGPELVRSLAAKERDGSTLKVNLALKGRPRFTCLEADRGQYGPTIHLLPDEHVALATIRRAHAEAMAGRLPEFPAIEWYFHTPIDPSLRDEAGHESAALFVQWVPYALADGRSWRDVAVPYAEHLLAICDRFAPGTSDLVADMMVLPPPAIEERFGIHRGHIHHVDNAFGFTDRAPHRFGPAGLYSCSAGTHPGGAVIGAAGHNAAKACLEDLGIP
jgi:phytoene dehydrogenase-like protein